MTASPVLRLFLLPIRNGIMILLARGATQGFIASRYNTNRSHLSYWLKKRALHIPLILIAISLQILNKLL